MERRLLRSRLARHARAGVAAWALCAPLLCVAQTGAGRFYEDALTRFEKRDYAGAIVQLKNALQSDRNALAAHVLLGRALLANGEVNAAEVAFNDALRLGVNRAEVVVPLAQSLILQGKQAQVLEQEVFNPTGLPREVQAKLLMERAVASADVGDGAASIRALDQARTLAVELGQVWLAEVPIRIRNRQLTEAATAVERALALLPDSADAWMHKGSIAHVQGDAKAALAAYERALKVDPAHVAALGARAGLYADLGRDEDAGRDVAELLRLAPNDLRGLYLRSLLAQRKGDDATARAALREITNLLDPIPVDYIRYRPQLLILAALSHYSLDQRAKAKPLLETVIRANGPSAASKLLAEIHLSENNLDRAIETLEPYLKLEPDDPQALLLLASTYMAQGRHVRATNLMQDALRRRDAPELRTVLGLSLIGGGQRRGAVVELEAALKRDPLQTRAGAALVGLYLKARQLDKAVGVAEGLVKASPRNASFQNLLGIAYAESRRAEQARKAFEAAMRADPALTAAQVNLARLDLGSDKVDAARGRLDVVLQRNANDVDALFEMGNLELHRGRTQEAARWFGRAADVAGGRDARPLLALIDLHLRSGNAKAARAESQKLSARLGETIPTLLAAARTQLADRDVTAARTTLARVSRLAGAEPDVQVEVALLQSLAGDIAGADYSLEKALAAQPDNVRALALRADNDIKRRDFALAEQRARQLLVQFPKLPIGHLLLGELARARGQHAAAAEAYRRAQQLAPAADTLERLMSSLERSGNRAAALQAGTQWLQAHPGDVATRRWIADAHARHGDLAAARAQYDAVLARAPRDAQALNNLANIQLLQKDGAALTTAERALSIAPGDANVIGTAGHAALQAGQVDRAVQLLRDARLRNPGNPQTRYLLAQALSQSGRRTEAREELEAALRISRDFASAKDAEALLATLK